LVVDEEFNLKGLITIKDINKKIMYPNATKDKLGRLRVGAAIGVGERELDRIKALIEAKVDTLVIDTAHGHSGGVIDMIRKVKNAYPDIPLIAGNVATAEGARDLIKAGADCIKVGVVLVQYVQLELYQVPGSLR